MKRICNLNLYKIRSRQELIDAENAFRLDKNKDYLPFADGGTKYTELAEEIFKDQNGDWSTPLFVIKCSLDPIQGMENSCFKAIQYVNILKKKEIIDLLSVSSYMEDNRIKVVVLLRAYNGNIDFKGYFQYLNAPLFEEEKEEERETGNLVIPDEIAEFSYTQEEIENHKSALINQQEIFNHCSLEHPFLNSIENYEPLKLPHPSDKMDFVYDLKTNDMKYKTHLDYDTFVQYFNEIMTYVNGTEYYHYINVIKEEPGSSVEEFMDALQAHINKEYVKTGKIKKEDIPTMMNKLHRSLFQLYIVQDLVDDPMVTDIKITAPDSIRARVKGKAYITNINFIDVKDYLRFINVIVIKNRISLNVPEQTFTDTSDENFIIRYSITSDYVNAPGWPYLHIRKIDRNKLMDDRLFEAGMFTPKIRDYLRDCARYSRGVVFAGPPGSGKTVLLNWFLEQYEQSAEVLVIQENDELFTDKKGVMFQHVVNYSHDGELPVNLEELGKLALVAGANVFVIGEAKGAEICSAITLSNSGCRTALTIHTNSSTDTIDKMADLAMRGYAQDIIQAKRMLRSFQTIVYLQDFKVKEISEILGYNEEKQDMDYRYIYRYREDGA